MFVFLVFSIASSSCCRRLPGSYYRSAHALILCFAIDDRESFENLSNWNSEIAKFYETSNQSNGNKMPVLFLVGTKIDLENEKFEKEKEKERFAKNEKGKRVVTREEAERFAREVLKCPYLETSSKSDVNVSKLFNVLTTMMYKKFGAEQIEERKAMAMLSRQQRLQAQAQAAAVGESSTTVLGSAVKWVKSLFSR